MTSKTTTKTVLTWALSAAVLGGALAGCSDSTGSSAPNTAGSPTSASRSQEGEHNQADVTFAQSMIPHHAQAVMMAEMVPSHTSNPKMIDLAKRIQSAQQPEIDQMTGWLKAWGEPVAASSASNTPGMDHNQPMGGMNHGAGMPGMMTQQDMASLQSGRGSGFDSMWLRMMVQHHEGAIEMARTELREGSNPEAKELAQKIIAAQQAEITEMKGMLGQS